MFYKLYYPIEQPEFINSLRIEQVYIYKDFKVIVVKIYNQSKENLNKYLAARGLPLPIYIYSSRNPTNTQKEMVTIDRIFYNPIVKSFIKRME